MGFPDSLESELPAAITRLLGTAAPAAVKEHSASTPGLWVMSEGWPSTMKVLKWVLQTHQPGELKRGESSGWKERLGITRTKRLHEIRLSRVCFGE